MNWWLIALIVVASLSCLAGVCWFLDWRQQRRLYREKVGLDLAGLVALLPTDLQSRHYTDYVIARWARNRICVGLVYDDGRLRCGNPPNVGLAFDRRDGSLLEVHPAGVGLGIK
jgi:hypothetical protein